MNGAQWVARTLRNRGVEYVFVLCGNGLDLFLDACIDFDLRVVDVRNEQAASYMADTWGRMTRRLGVAAVSSGPGHTNALTGLANSFWDGGPMLLISGCSPQSTRGMDHFQELDQVAMAAPVCKYASMVRHVENLQHELDTALSVTVTGRPGPVHLTIPVDVFNAEIDESTLLRQDLPPAQVVQRSPGDGDLVRDAVAMLASAQRPFMLVGSGAFYAQAWDALAEFARLTDVPIVSHIWDRCCIEQAIPQYVGVTNGELNRAMCMLSQADVVLSVGARIDYRVSHGRPPGFARDARVARVDIEPSEIGRTIVPDIGVVGSPRSVLEQMAEEARRLGPWANAEWLAKVRAQRDVDPHLPRDQAISGSRYHLSPGRREYRPLGAHDPVRPPPRALVHLWRERRCGVGAAWSSGRQAGPARSSAPFTEWRWRCRVYDRRDRDCSPLRYALCRRHRSRRSVGDRGGRSGGMSPRGLRVRRDPL